MTEVFAKSEPPVRLEDHIHDCLVVFRQVLGWKAPLIRRLCERCNIEEAHFIRHAFFAVCFHDLGKATLSFQKKLKGEEQKQESHSLASVPILSALVKDRPLVTVDEIEFYPEVLAVVSHHTKLHNELFDGYLNYEPDYIVEYVEWFCDKVNKFAQEFSIPLEQPVVFSETQMMSESPYSVFDRVFGSISRLNTLTATDYAKQSDLRDTFVIIKAVLHYCDWLASGRKLDFEYALVDGTLSVDRIMVEKAGKVEWKMQFQLSAENVSQHLMVQIPTGQGKTEASLLWATRFGIGRKVIYLLPTMVTTNKMWKRLCAFFGENTVGITHSTASYILHKHSAELEDQELRKQLLYHKTFMHPVTVATVDQLLFSFFNWGHWVLSNANAYNACIVIDEVHTYDAYTLGIVLKMIEIVKDWNAHFAIMSATFPDYLRRQVERILGSNISVVSDQRFDDMQRTQLDVGHLESGNPIEHTIEEIQKRYELGNKVLVICNTVDKSKEVYQKVCEFVPRERRMLYHSQFINKDKFAKEEQLENVHLIERGFVAVTTQIVEVSLDIDFDVMFTENAPIDALVQRLGRVNRKGSKGFAKVFICAESEKSRKYVYNRQLLDLTRKSLVGYTGRLRGNLKEKHYRDIVNKIYREENFDEDFEEELTEGKSLIGDIWRSRTNLIYTLDANDRQLYAKTRREKYLTVEVVLEGEGLDAVTRSIEEKRYWQVQDWTLKVPYYRVKNFLIPEKIGKSDLFIAKCSYNAETGVEYKDNNSNFA
jgi:CRISPR-associated endonuclease/helicase Cas3